MTLWEKDCGNPTIRWKKGCVAEHVESDCKLLGCFGDDLQFAFLPNDKQVQLVSHQKKQYKRVRAQEAV
jgi:hypothetical protein